MTESVQKKARQRILEAAKETFTSLGYTRTTTQIIAEKALVAEITLFRHFGSKEKLFQVAVADIGDTGKMSGVADRLSGEPRADLILIGGQLLTYFIEQQDAIRMLMFESIHFPEMKAALAQNPAGQMGLLNQYFQQQMDAGKLKQADAQQLSVTFISMFFGYAMGINPVQSTLSLELTAEEAVVLFVDQFLNGAAA